MNKPKNNNNFEPPSPLQTAVLFLVFKRPDTTSRVFEAIRTAKPPRLYVAADGPRTDNLEELEKIETVRRIATNVDWPCEVKTLFRTENLGCRYAVSQAISWFFENEEQGIILEDDCLPSQSFFWFCEACLDKYKNDLRIWHIAGTNLFEKSYSPVISSYCFSFYGSIWGWASWRNRWCFYDPELENIKKDKLLDFVLKIYDKKECPQIRVDQFERIMNGMDTWDYQWFFTRAVNSGLSIVPSVNLVSNIGYGKDATHTLNRQLNSHFQEICFPLKSPPCIIRDKVRDLGYVKKFVCPPFRRRLKIAIISFINRKLFALQRILKNEEK